MILVDGAIDLNDVLNAVGTMYGIGDCRTIAADPASNSGITAAVPAIPAAYKQVHILMIVAGYTAAGTGALTISAGTPSAGINYTVTAGTDLFQELRSGECLFTASPTI